MSRYSYVKLWTPSRWMALQSRQKTISGLSPKKTSHAKSYIIKSCLWIDVHVLQCARAVTQRESWMFYIQNA